MQRAGRARRRKTRATTWSRALVNAEVDGERLTDQEIGSFFILLVVAGNETTRNAIAARPARAHRAPRAAGAWQADFDGLAATAVEEIVRWATPVIYMRRTVTQDAELGGHQFKEGDKVLLFYNSANRDEAVFDDPTASTSRRDPNPHVGFGGPGPHFCLGAHLARREITVMFRELFDPGARHPRRRRARPAALQLHQRHQAPALPLFRTRLKPRS